MPALFDKSDHDKHRFWNTAPVNPLAEAKKRGLAYTSRRPLMPESAFPFGEHLGKTMRQVPHDYLRWIDAQPWASTWRLWLPVRDYLERFPLPSADGVMENGSDGKPTTPPLHHSMSEVLICVSPIAVDPNARGVFKDGACRLYAPQEAHQPFLHAFAQGALDLRPDWLRHADDTAPPHYLLSPERQNRAIEAGAVLVTRRQADEHAWHWKRAHGASGMPFVRQMPDGTQRCTKHCYATEKEAQTVINQRTMGRRRVRHGRPTYLRSYLCPQCGFHHLTSQPLEP